MKTFNPFPPDEYYYSALLGELWNIIDRIADIHPTTLSTNSFPKGWVTYAPDYSVSNRGKR